MAPDRRDGDNRAGRDVELLSLLANLPELAMAHLLSDDRVALIIETGRSRCVQMMLTEGHEIVVECVSNRYLDDDEALSLDDELHLLELGYEPAEGVGEPHPNFWWHSVDSTRSCGPASWWPGRSVRCSA